MVSSKYRLPLIILSTGSIVGLITLYIHNKIDNLNEIEGGFVAVSNANNTTNTNNKDSHKHCYDNICHLNAPSSNEWHLANDLKINTLSVSNLNGKINIGCPASNGLIMNVIGDCEFKGNLTVDKTMLATDLVSFSDERLKDCIADIPYGTTEFRQGDAKNILNLTGITFNWKPELDIGVEGRKYEYGFKATEVQKFFPDLVYCDELQTKGYLTVDYVKMIPLLIEVIKNQNERIQDLEKLINNYKKL